ncbi:hypothetical protein [Flavobacterium johnsoniae]|uniref:NodB homology domain-containing protein n=1 Tax=Flavobacterium johnsoniae TaxID=986 RepID=A0A1M5L0R8_FLAJO|nr:hypothetical protein [Flavobacterium johnsoniae]SHG58586.1 hypothetical protein SAMN05444388_103286 [Flavobacterium johnsoniae]
MIKTISLITASGKQEIVFDQNHKHKIFIDFDHLNVSEINSFDLEIVFTQSISQFRNHDYTWVNWDKDRISNEYCPKIIKLKNGQLVQANINKGIWEVNQNNSAVLLWRFNPEFSEPITNYLGYENKKNVSQSNKRYQFTENPALLFPVNHALEFSRSAYPFTAVACFTDHCDFDTKENLALQRTFFDEHKIKITKGFFLNHYSKRNDNASFQNESEELLKWHNDGHELCYHSLLQSLKFEKENYEDFRNFVPPLNNLKVWIDHGFQPYNFSLLKNNILSEEEFENNLKEKEISILWNYIDSGTSTTGVINQLNTEHFTLSSFLLGNQDLKFVKKIQLMIKNIIFHYYNEEGIILKYKNTAGNFKKVLFQKKVKSFFPLIRDSFGLFTSIFSVVLSWGKAKNKPYKLAKYSPIVFKHIIHEKEFYIFQTLEMLDFQKSLSVNNIETLIKEKGIFIAHTYFSVPMEYHKGKLFSSENVIDKKVSDNFKVLGEKIQNKEIWNPTLTELIEYWMKFEDTILDIDLDGMLSVKKDLGLISRKTT